MTSAMAENMVIQIGTTVADDTQLASLPQRNVLEQVLIQRVQAGDAEAFYQLVRPYERAVFIAAVAIVKNDADAEEVVQEAILKAFKALGRFRQEAKFSTWLIQIAINEAKMRLRKDRRHLYESIEQGQQSDDGDYIPKDFADWREIPSQALERRELRDALQGPGISPREIPRDTGSARCKPPQHHGNRADPRPLGSERQDEALTSPSSDARCTSLRLGRAAEWQRL